MYNERTIINGNDVKLTEEEQTNVTKFHKSRIAFAVIEKDNDYVLAMNINDPREHRVYLKEDFNVDDEMFETLVRGYIKPGKINIYVSSHFYKVPSERINDKLLNDLLEVALNEYGEGEYIIGNGVNVGKPGEEWPPIEIIKKSDLRVKIKKKV